jgi:ComF family protein
MWLDGLVGLVAPFECLACGREGKLLCASCRARRLKPKRSTCFLCNALTQNYQTCATCRRKTRASGVVAAIHYEGIVKQLIGRLKYHRAAAAAGELTEILWPRLKAGRYTMVTAVPATPKRFRLRGYNQSRLIARALAQRLGLPYRELLYRSGSSRQVGTSRRQRLTQMQGAMRPAAGYRISGHQILVVDDVVTTGATISEAARALKQAGARSVWGAAVAKH